MQKEAIWFMQREVPIVCKRVKRILNRCIELLKPVPIVNSSNENVENNNNNDEVSSPPPPQIPQQQQTKPLQLYEELDDLLEEDDDENDEISATKSNKRKGFFETEEGCRGFLNLNGWFIDSPELYIKFNKPQKQQQIPTYKTTISKSNPWRILQIQNTYNHLCSILTELDSIITFSENFIPPFPQHGGNENSDQNPSLNMSNSNHFLNSSYQSSSGGQFTELFSLCEYVKTLGEWLSTAKDELLLPSRNIFPKSLYQPNPLQQPLPFEINVDISVVNCDIVISVHELQITSAETSQFKHLSDTYSNSPSKLLRKSASLIRTTSPNGTGTTITSGFHPVQPPHQNLPSSPISNQRHTSYNHSNTQNSVHFLSKTTQRTESIEEIDLKDDKKSSSATTTNNNSTTTTTTNNNGIKNSITSSIFNISSSVKKAISNKIPHNVLYFSQDKLFGDIGEDPLLEEDQSSEFEKWLRLGEDIPHYSWARRLDHNFPDHKQFQVSIWQGLKLMGLGYRMWKYVKKELTSGRLPIMDPFNIPKPGPLMGVPIGGIGSGSITRGWKGDFVRWNLGAGITTNRSIDADKFSVYIRFHNESSNGGNSGNISRNNSFSNLSSNNNNNSTTTTSNNINNNNVNINNIQNINNYTKRATVLYPGKPKSNVNLDVWNWGLQGNNSCYFGLFPRSWTVYEEPHSDIKLVCKQISPVLPHNYKESSYPCGVFVWKIENNSSVSAADISLMFTWQNSDGTDSDAEGGHHNKSFVYQSEDGKGGKIKGITLYHKKQQTVVNSEKKTTTRYNDPFEMSIAVKDDPDVQISYVSRWDTTNRLDAANIWYNFNKSGTLENTDDTRPSQPGKPIAAAIAAKVTVAAGESKTVVFSIAWDSPICRFQLGSAYYRRYTKFYGTSGQNSQRIAFDAINNYRSWERDIVLWQNPILQDPNLPQYYKMALFNELYYFVDGGSIWTNGSPTDESNGNGIHKSPINSKLQSENANDPNYIGRFAYLESQEYLMYNTYDVHFYASYALSMLWPLLEVSLQNDFADATLVDYGFEWECIHSGQKIPRKIRGAVPHDLGNPGEDPWKRVNSYNIQDVSRWKDLPCKFVLQIYRDYLVTQDKNFILQIWGVIEEAIRRAYEYDTDNDGVVDNEGFPDQTYDTWSCVGCSAYTGGLWLACLKAAAEIAKILGFKEDEFVYNKIFEKGKISYNSKLWNGHYFNYDCSKNPHFDSIMADMLAGHWYLVSCGLPSYITFDQALSSLSFINEYNIKSYGNGNCGAVNGMRPDGKVDTTSLQSSEVWIGTSFSLAATMFLHKMDKEGWSLIKGLVDSSYNKWGFQYQTPEAWDNNGCYRAASYMRPLAIWSVQWALEKRANLIPAVFPDLEQQSSSLI
eukprot:gene10051-12320_t